MSVCWGFRQPRRITLSGLAIVMGHSSPKRKIALLPSKQALPIQPAKAALRRRYHQLHLQSWAYDQCRFGSFRGWITTSPHSSSYALGKPVLCLVRATNSPETTKVHLKLFRRQGRRGGAEPGTYYALIRVGAGWLNEEEWFKDFVNDRARISAQDPKWWALRSGSNPKDSMTEDQVRPGDWLDVGHKFRLTDLPQDVFRYLLPFIVDKPKDFVFFDQRMSPKGRYVSQYFPGQQSFCNYSQVCKSLNHAVNSWCYSTSTFVFQWRSAFTQFLSQIGENNRRRLKKVVLQFSCYDYFDTFTPRDLVVMLDVSLWSFDKISLRSNISKLQLEELTIRLPDGDGILGEYPHPGYDIPYERLSPLVDISWIMASVLHLQSETGFPKRIRFEAANVPHRRIQPGSPYTLDWTPLM